MSSTTPPSCTPAEQTQAMPMVSPSPPPATPDIDADTGEPIDWFGMVEDLHNNREFLEACKKEISEAMTKSMDVNGNGNAGIGDWQNLSGEYQNLAGCAEPSIQFGTIQLPSNGKLFSLPNQSAIEQNINQTGAANQLGAGSQINQHGFGNYQQAIIPNELPEQKIGQTCNQVACHNPNFFAINQSSNQINANRLVPLPAENSLDCRQCELAHLVVYKNGALEEQIKIHQSLNGYHMLLTTLAYGNDGTATTIENVSTGFFIDINHLLSLFNEVVTGLQQKNYVESYNSVNYRGNNMGGIPLYQVPTIEAPFRPASLMNQSPNPIERLGSEEIDQIKGPFPPLPSGCMNCVSFRQIVHTRGNETKRMEFHRRGEFSYHSICSTQIFEGRKGAFLQLDESPFIGPAMDAVVNVYLSTVGNYALVRDLHLPGNEAAPGIKNSQSSTLGRRPLTTQNRTPTTTTSKPTQVPVSRRQVESGFVGPLSASGQVIKNVGHTRMAQQRVKAARMTLDDLTCYMSLNLAAAAKKLDVCPSLVKKICRRYGITRWPYRKIRSLDKRIYIVEEQIKDPRNACAIDALRKELEELKIARKRAFLPPNASKIKLNDEEFSSNEDEDDEVFENE